MLAAYRGISLCSSFIGAVDAVALSRRVILGFRTRKCRQTTRERDNFMANLLRAHFRALLLFPSIKGALWRR